MLKNIFIYFYLIFETLKVNTGCQIVQSQFALKEPRTCNCKNLKKKSIDIGLLNSSTISTPVSSTRLPKKVSWMQNTNHFQNFPKGADTMIIDSPFIQAEQSGDRSLPKMMISLKKV